MELKYLRILLFAIIVFGCQKRYPLEQVYIEVKPDAELVKSGKRLTLSICGPCHYNPDLKNLSGKPMLDVPRVVGKVYAANLTQHPKFGIEDYTPGELKFLLKTGIKKNGELSPYMAKPNLADEDIKAIIAFLKSEDEMVKPSANNGAHKYSPMGKLALNKLFDPYEYRSQEIKRPKAADTVALGKYLVDITGCYECHSANILKTNRLFPEQSKGYMGGGSLMKSANGKYIKTPNLTFHESGLMQWSLNDFEKALREGISKENKILSYPMPNYNYLTSSEIAAIYKYLKSIRPVKGRNKNHGNSNSSTQAVTGETLYQKYSCINCHGPSGKGIADLTSAYLKYDDHDLRNKIKNPSPSTGMPAFDGVIKEEEYSLLINYVKALGEKSKAIESARK